MKSQPHFPRELVKSHHQNDFLKKTRELYSKEKPEGLKYSVYNS